MPDSVQLPQGVRRYRFQGGCGEHEENGRMLLNPRWCLDGEWISIADLPTILAAERERWERELGEGVELIAAERKRQVDEEGWIP